jgi:hypothetical protein
MDKILRLSVPDADITVQPGVKWEDLNAYLKEKGVPLFFPLDPGPGATIGGMCGTGCSGTNAVRYGTAKAEWFLNLVSEQAELANVGEGAVTSVKTLSRAGGACEHVGVGDSEQGGSERGGFEQARLLSKIRRLVCQASKASELVKDQGTWNSYTNHPTSLLRLSISHTLAVL